MYFVLCVIDQPDHLQPLLQAWHKGGIPGVTIIESTGLHRLSEQTRVPMRYAFANPSAERGNITLITVVESEDMIQRCLQIAETVVGDFNEPNTGIFVSWPVGFAKGVNSKETRQP